MPGGPGLYLHVPFCSSVCPYCDFSVLKAGPPARQRFVERLLAEVPLAAHAWTDPRAFDTVYFGGGTPSQLTPEDLGRVLEACRAHLALASPWVFLEVNPEDVTAGSCAAWRALGVRTLSLGVQSLADEALRFLGRRHDARRGRAAVDTALAAGFDTVSLDLIFGLPGQAPDAWRRDLEAAVALSPHHVSCYQLTIHARTRFGVAARRGQLAEMPEGEQAVLFALTERVLGDAGFGHYEVSNFARGPGHESRHNRKYWDHTPYLGLGPSAHSLAVVKPGASARRWWNELRTSRWEARLAEGARPVEGEEALGPKALATEAVLLGLRTAQGIDLESLASLYGLDLVAANALLVDRLAAEGHVAVSLGADGGRRLVPTSSGMAVADGMAAAFDVPLAG